MMKTVSMTINGKKIYAEEGTTILEAARQNGIFIPTLCYHPRLRPLGHCRLCLVKLEGRDMPVTACDNPVLQGMVITTDTPELHLIRQEILALLLADHPAKDCLTCEKGGTCELQANAYTFGVTVQERLKPDPRVGAAEDDNLYLVRDEDKCILCGRCIRVCADVAGRFVFRMVGNGLATRIVPYRDGREVSLEEAGCNFCGQCIDACPVGALLEKSRLGRGREWEFQSASGVCVECSLGCACERRVLDHDLVRVTVPEHGERFSWLCHKGKFGAMPVGETRILQPRWWRGDTEQETGWDEALAAAASVLNELKSKHGGSSLAVIGNGRNSNEESYLLHRLAREALDTAQIDLGVEPGYARATAALAETAGLEAYGPSLTDLAGAEAILVLGDGLAESHPVAAMAVKRAAHFGGAALIQAGTGSARETIQAWSVLDLVYQPGREIALLSALSAAAGQEYTNGSVEAGLPLQEIVRAAALLLTRNSYTLVTPPFLGILEAAGGTESLRELLGVARALGQVEKGRTNLLLLSGASNARGILDAGGTPFYRPGYLPAEKEGLWRCDLTRRIKEGQIKGLVLVGSDRLPELDLSGLEFCLVLGATMKTNGSGPDCLLLPEEALHEKEGSFTGTDGRLRFNHAAGTRAVREGWRVLAELCSLFGLKADYRSLDAVRKEMWGSVMV